MSAITFDTLKFADALKESGVPAKQAEAHAHAMAEALQSSEVVTGADLKVAITQLKTELVQWMIGLLLAQAALIAGILIALLRVPK